MSYLDVTEYLVKLLLGDVDFSVKQFETLDNDYLLIKVFVAEKHLGQIIGKKGQIANSIRNIVQATVTEEYQVIKIEFEGI